MLSESHFEILSSMSPKLQTPEQVESPSSDNLLGLLNFVRNDVKVSVSSKWSKMTQTVE
ncbi:hypothetical protein ES703_87621 [subsurface metagenome]